MFRSTNFNLVAKTQGFAQWHYKTTDKLTTLLEANYFNELLERPRFGRDLAEGDIIIARCDVDEDPRTAFLEVRSIKDESVDVGRII